MMTIFLINLYLLKQIINIFIHLLHIFYFIKIINFLKTSLFFLSFNIKLLIKLIYYLSCNFYYLHYFLNSKNKYHFHFIFIIITKRNFVNFYNLKK